MMKHRMERLVAFPFAPGCVSASSVAVCVQHGRRSKEDIDSSHTVCGSFDIPKDPKDGGAPPLSDNMMKTSFRLASLSKPNVSTGLQRLTKSIKNLSHSLVFKEEMDDVQMDFEIGLPTNVKHVAHVGFDGSVTSKVTNGRENINASDFLGFCPLSFAQLEERLSLCVPLDGSRVMENVLQDTTQTSNKTEAGMA